MRTNSSLKMDMLFAIIANGIGILIVWLIKMSNPEKFKESITSDDNIIFIIICCFILLVILYIAYIEAKHDDEYITGKTQTMGVVNSFTSLPALMIFVAFIFEHWVAIYVVSIVLFFLMRMLGRRSRKKLSSMIGKIGVMKTNLHYKGTASFDGKDVKVYSKKDIYYGAKVKIVDLKAKYLYVEEVNAEVLDDKDDVVD